MDTLQPPVTEPAHPELLRVRLPMPFRFKPDRVGTEDELLHFTAANSDLQWERESDGTIVMMTPAGGMGNIRENYVAMQLTLWAEQDGSGIAFACNAGFKLEGNAVRSPDAAWVPNEKWHALTEDEQDSFLPFCPTFVIEVMSKTDSLPVVEAKTEEWMANGAALGWLINPYRATVAVFRPGREMERFERPEAMLGEGCIAGFKLPMERLWA